MRKKRCPYCDGLNTKHFGFRTKRRKTAQGFKPLIYQRWYCNNCQRAFKPSKDEKINFGLKVKACELYYDAESSYRAVGRQLNIKPERVFKIVNDLGAHCKSTIDVARELQPQWSGYLLIDEKSIWIKAVEWYVLIAVDLTTQDIIHWDLVPSEDEVNVAWFMIVIKYLIKYPMKGLISDLLAEFYETSRWLFPGIDHQFCTYHAYRSTEFYIKYHYSGGDQLWAKRLLDITRIICRCQTVETAIRALNYLERHQPELQKAKLIKRLRTLRLRFPHLIKRFKDQNLKPDNNVVENVIKQLNQKFKKVAGFEYYETAYNSIKLLVMRYRFHKFSCSRKIGHNGKSPLELAGGDITNLNWVRFSQRT
jgi:transposase-like protein